MKYPPSFPRLLVPALAALATAGTAAESDHPTVNALGDVALVDDRMWVEAASRRKQLIQSTPQPVVVLTADDLFNTPAVSIPDRLRYVAGVDVYQDRAAQFEVGIHGYNGITNNRMLALYDGRQFTLEEFGSVVWQGPLPLSDIARIEIVKGPSSVTYGANAFGGVISMQGREIGASHQLFGVAGLGTTGYREADATALGPIGHHGEGPQGAVAYYKVSAGGSGADARPAETGATTHIPSSRTADYGNTDLEALRWRALTGIYLPGNHRLEADYRGSDLRQWQMIHDLDIGANAAQIRQQDLSARLVGTWGEISQTRGWGQRDSQNQKSIYIPGPTYGDFHYSQAGFDDTLDQTRAQINQTLGAHALSLGGEFWRWQSTSNLWSNTGTYANRESWETITTYNRAAFIEDQWSIAQRWIVTGGLRIDGHSQAGSETSPRVALNFAPDPTQVWRLSYSRGYRLPTGIESNILQYYFRSDPDLRAERLQEIDLGWSKRLDRTSSLSINSFYSYGDRLIGLSPLSETDMAANWMKWLMSGPNFTKQPGPFFTYANQDNPVEIWGADASAELGIDQTPLSVFANGTWQYYRNKNDVVYHSNGFVDRFSGNTLFAFDKNLGRDINAPPEWKGVLGVKVATGSWFGSAAGRAVSGRHTFSFANSTFSTGDVAEQRIPGYAALDLSIGFQGESAQRFIRLSVMDLFNSAHYEAYHSSSELLSANYVSEHSAEVGRSVVVQGGWNF